jgi:molybdopterin-guanine dinucleotide biosynthesis protein A
MRSSGCSGAVLAGGANRRFDGIAKGLLQVGGRRVVDRVLDELRRATDELFLITNDRRVREATSEVPGFADVRRERGSLIGLHSALTHCRDAVIVAAWDMPFLSSALLAALRERGEQGSTAVIPEGPFGPEPLCAYYPRSCLATVEMQIGRGELRLSALIDALPSRIIVSRDDVARFGSPARLFANINTPADLEEARRLAGPEFPALAER